jgi:hypothetical protein
MMSDQYPVFSTLDSWDGKSDIILVGVGADGTLEAKIAPAEGVHHVLNKYREFIDRHGLVLDSLQVDDAIVYTMRWRLKDEAD